MNATKTVLLLDDDDDQLCVISLLLEKENYKVIPAKSGSEALSLLKDNPVDVVIADICMPDMTGIEFACHFKNSPSGQSIPVVLMTAGLQPLDFTSTPFRADLFCMKQDFKTRLLPALKRFEAQSH
jgi:CheY-like chemotaxis protein